MTTKTSFSDLQTRREYPADEVISALQKEIRRGNFEDASYWGLELLESGEQFTNKLWERLYVISVEDVADHQAICIISDLHKAFKELHQAKEADKAILIIKAIQVLSTAQKDRIVNEMYDYLRFTRKDGVRKEIPPYAIDKHTKKGKEQGLGYEHFLQTAAHITNIVENKDMSYYNELLLYAKKGYSPSSYKKENELMK